MFHCYDCSEFSEADYVKWRCAYVIWCDWFLEQIYISLHLLQLIVTRVQLIFMILIAGLRLACRRLRPGNCLYYNYIAYNIIDRVKILIRLISRINPVPWWKKRSLWFPMWGRKYQSHKVFAGTLIMYNVWDYCVLAISACNFKGFPNSSLRKVKSFGKSRYNRLAKLRPWSKSLTEKGTKVQPLA